MIYGPQQYGMLSILTSEPIVQLGKNDCAKLSQATKVYLHLFQPEGM